MKIEFEDLKSLVVGWAERKGILEHGTPIKQLLKTLEEITELHTAIEDDNLEEIIDAIGDVVVTLVIYAKMKSITLFPNGSEELSDSKGTAQDPYFLLDNCNKLMQLEKFTNDTIEKYYTVQMMLFLLNQIANRFNLKIWECLHSAYKVISCRKGKMIDGQFVKD
jgi:COG1694: predicted pyrophosphatase|nr:MAG TPA: NTP-PPase-like protein [Bacteriophage sp.]